jgi:hypothetical protein
LLAADGPSKLAAASRLLYFPVLAFKLMSPRGA